MRNIQHLFFDLDRTLWDFEKNSEMALHLLFHDLGLDQRQVDFHQFHQTYKEQNAVLWKLYGKGELKKEELRFLRFEITLEAFGISDRRIIDELSDGYVAISPKQTLLHDGALETLDQLKSDGYSMHIITNGFKEVQYIKLENSGLAPYFDTVVCSEELGKNKPAPEIFYHALTKAGAKNTGSVMIGDDPEVDVVGAINAGLSGILFDPEDVHRTPHSAVKIKRLSELSDVLPWLR
jgi:putative hydrolase of the HAD superfamily